MLQHLHISVNIIIIYTTFIKKKNEKHLYFIFILTGIGNY
jgi:hypothetical protein